MKKLTPQFEYQNSSDQSPSKKENNSLSPPTIHEYLNTQQAAKYLQVSTQWLEIGRVKGYGPPFIKLSRLVRYKKSDLDQWMGSHRKLNTVGL